MSDADPARPDAAAVAIAAAWIEALPVNGPDDGLVNDFRGGSGWRRSLAEALERGGVATPFGLRDEAAPDQPAELSPALVDLLAEVTTSLAATSTSPLLLRRLDELNNLVGGSGREWPDAAAVARLHAGPARTLLLRLAESLIADRDNPRHERLIRGAGEPGVFSTYNLWPRGQFFPLRAHAGYVAAAAAWPADFMALLHDAPTLIAHAVMEAVERGPADLKALLRAAPPVFDESGQPTGGSAVYSIFATLTEQVNADGLTEAEAAALAQQIESRPDRQWLARTLIQRLIWETAHRPQWRTAEADRSADVMRLAEALATGLAPLPDATAWIAAEVDVWQTDRVLTEAMVLACGGDRVTAGAVLVQGVVAGHASPTGRPRGLDQYTLESRIVGHIVSHQPDPAAWFQALWKETYDARERLRIPARHGLNNPAFAALAWAVTGLNCLSDRSQEQAQLWAVLRSALIETHVTLYPRGIVSDLALIERVVVLIALKLVSDRRIPEADLSDFIAHIAEPTPEFARLCGEVAPAAEPGPLALFQAADGHRLRLCLERGLARSQDPRQQSALTPDQAAAVEALTAQLPS